MLEREIRDTICVCMSVCVCVRSTAKMAVDISGRDGACEIKCKMESDWEMEIMSICYREYIKIRRVRVYMCVCFHSEQGTQVSTHCSEHAGGMCWILNTALFHCPDSSLEAEMCFYISASIDLNNRTVCRVSNDGNLNFQRSFSDENTDCI